MIIWDENGQKKAERNNTNLSMITNNKPIYYALTANLRALHSSRVLFISFYLCILVESLSLSSSERPGHLNVHNTRIGFRFVTKTL